MLFEAAPYVTLANTPDEPSVFEIEEKKSRFIGRACHVENEEQAREFVARVRALEHGARYFGGTLLGTGGLVRAYTKAAQGALENAQLMSMISCVDVQVIMPYSLYDTALYTLEKAAAKVLSTGFTDQVTLFFRMKEGEVDPVVESLRELLAGRGELVTGDPHLDSW